MTTLDQQLTILEQQEPALFEGHLPLYITENLNPNFLLRDYQVKALKRFLYHTKKNPQNRHLLFEMATGSGKTLLMASLMLHLYQQGERIFIFFVNSTAIIEKTKQNFLSPNSSKYLFANHISINNQRVQVNAITNLNDVIDSQLNILFTTIQGLHSQLKMPRENGLSTTELHDKSIVLLADEAHHISSQTKANKDLFATWENTITDIQTAHSMSWLIEFTATAELNSAKMQEKYNDKLIMQYGFKQFRDDNYSKNVYIIQTQTEDLRSRFLLSVLTSQFRQSIASRYGIIIKPIILFKSKDIASSQKNHQNFHEMIEQLRIQDLEKIFTVLRSYAHNVPLFKKMLAFFTSDDLSLEHLLAQIKTNFSVEHSIDANSEKEVEKQQILLNTLEDATNPIRTIFAVNKLNEGWDVLNLFDIVKLYETKEAKKPPTTQEIQLIGRGARYYPFDSGMEGEKYQRKYDKDVDNDLAVLEQLHFHCEDDSRFIRQLALDAESAGLMENGMREEVIELKDEFKQTDIYKNGLVWLNERVSRKKQVHSVDLFGAITDKEIVKNLRGKYQDWTSIQISHLGDGVSANAYLKTYTLSVHKVRKEILHKAIESHNTFQFDKLVGLRRGLHTKYDIIKQDLSDAQLIIECDRSWSREQALSPYNILCALQDLLKNYAEELEKANSIYVGTSLKPKKVKDVFVNKTILVKKDEELFLGDQYTLFGQTQFLGTSEEVELIKAIENYFRTADRQYSGEKVLLRNENHFTLYRKDDGRGFQPDFVLFMKDSSLTYQIFIEPKGQHLYEYDAWKNQLLSEIGKSHYAPLSTETIHFLFNHYRVIGLPFYNKGVEAEWFEKFKNSH